MTGTLTPDEIADACNRLLEPVTRHIRHRLGAEAADLTGSCLYKALTLYDRDRSNGLESFAKAKTLFLVVEALRETDGRKGTARYEFHDSVRSIENWDGPTPETTDEGAEQLGHTFNIINKTRELGKCILLGRVLCDMSNIDLCRILNVSQDQIYVETRALRQLVSSD